MKNGSIPTTSPQGLITAPLFKVCVFCGSGKGINPAYARSAKTLGKAMAGAGIGLVYGGGSLGLMGEIARSVLKSGGHVTGIIPDFLVERERMLKDVQELIVTRDMHERKMLMFQKSDGFVALPGGIGTLEELVEQLTWSQLGRHTKPIILGDVENFWAPLLRLFEHMRAEKFIREGLDFNWQIAQSAKDIVPLLLKNVKQSRTGAPAAEISAKF